MEHARAEEPERPPAAREIPAARRDAPAPPRSTWVRAGRVAHGTARGTYVAARRTARRIRRATHAEGAGETGLGKLIELHGISAAGDAMVTVALAGTLFFSVPVGEARGRVALYLLVTMAPFALMAPVVGPLLDRVRRGRRYAIAATLGLRAVLAYVMVGGVTGGQDPYRLYPAAFGTLVASRAYGVTRAAAVPRILPRGYGLVRANSRISLAGLVAGSVGGSMAALASLIGGPAAALKLAVVTLAIGAYVAVKLPAGLDAPQDDEAKLTGGEDETRRSGRKRVSVGEAVVLGVRANTALRAMAGFLVLYFAFLLRQHPLGGVKGTTALALVAGALGLGGALGTGVGARIRQRQPELVVLFLLGISTLTCALAAWLYGLIGVLAAAGVIGFSQSLGKLSLDALVQRDVPEDVRASAFSRAETVLQIGWVLGGAIGIVLPLAGHYALILAASCLAVALVLVGRGHAIARRRPAGSAP